MKDAGATLERYLRLGWTPLVLSTLIVVTWAAVDAFGDVFYTNEAERLFLRLMIILALQMFSGNSGVLSFGHVAFMAMGAYTSALLTIPKEFQFNFNNPEMPHWLRSWIFAELSPTQAVLAGAGFALVLALLFGIPIVRLSGVAAGIGTLAILVAMNVFIAQTTAVTRGTSTQIGVPKSTSLLSTMIWLVVIVAAAYAFKQSRIGLRLRAARENDRAARSVGVRIALERYIAFALSGFVCGIAGALYAHFFVTFAYLDFYFDLTFITIAMLVVGGMASVTGAVVGCYFLTIVYVAFQRFEVNGIGGTLAPSGTADLVLALALLVALILRPRGITGGKEIPWPTEWRRPRRPTLQRPALLVRLRGARAAGAPETSADTTSSQ